MCGWTVQTEGMWTLVWVLPTPISIFGMSEWCNNCLIQFTNCEAQRVSFKFQSGGWDAHVIEDRRPTSQIGWGCNCKSHCGEDITWEYKVCGPYVVTLSSWVPIFERCLMQCLPRACRWYSSRQIWTTQEALREAPCLEGPMISLVSIVGTFGRTILLAHALGSWKKGWDTGITLGFGPKKPRVQNTSLMDLAFWLNIDSQTRSFL